MFKLTLSPRLMAFALLMFLLLGNWQSQRFFLSFVVAFCSIYCIQSEKPPTLEYINAPVNLTVSFVAAQTYQLTFNADNREGGFGGYGVFTGSSSAAVDAYPADGISAAQAYCLAPSDFSARFDYKTPIHIQLGPSANTVSTGTLLCGMTQPILISGSYIAVRTRVERASKPWSAAAIALVP